MFPSADANLAIPGGCRAGRQRVRPIPDPGSLDVTIGSRLRERPRTGSSKSKCTAGGCGGRLRRAKRQRICCVPSIPSRCASASVSSNWRPGRFMCESITSVSTSVPPYEMKIFAPQGSTGLLTPSERPVRMRRQVVRSASRAAPREPASAVYQPVSATVTCCASPASRVVLVTGSRQCERAYDRDECDRRKGDRALQDAQAHRTRAATISPNDSRTRASKSTGRTPSGEANSRR